MFGGTIAPEHDEARSLQMLREPVRGDPGHYLPAVANLLSAAVAQGEGERLSEVFGRGGFQVDGLGRLR